jgi:PTS system sucrose-specific IIC component
MGEGIAIEPSEGKVFAPFDGVIAHVMIKSKHAVILEHETGVQMLVHIGINTVGLKGEGFTAHVNSGDIVTAGQLLIEFDMEAIQAAGLPLITPVLIPNGNDRIEQVMANFTGPVQANGKALIVVKFTEPQ